MKNPVPVFSVLFWSSRATMCTTAGFAWRTMPGISTSFAIIETATQAEVATVRTIQRLNCRRWELDFTEPLIYLSAKWKRALTRRRAKSRLSFSILLFVRLLGSLLCEGSGESDPKLAVLGVLNKS